MALTEDDAGLVRELRQHLARYDAEWIASDVDVELSVQAPGAFDATFEAEALLLAMSRTLGVLPDLLLDANETLRVFPAEADGVTIGDATIIFGEAELTLRHIAEAAAMIASPISDLLSEARDE
jgi:predicted Ser/Thr protein kinase